MKLKFNIVSRLITIYKFPQVVYITEVLNFVPLMNLLTNIQENFSYIYLAFSNLDTYSGLRKVSVVD